MARKKHHEEHANHEAWAIPYGDLITLLLAFFVVMYAMSSVNEGKYRILSDSLVAAFRGPPKSLQPIQVGNPSKSTSSSLQIERPRVLVPLEVDASKHVMLREDLQSIDPSYLRDGGLSPSNLDEASQLIDEISDAIEAQLGELVKEDLVRLHRNRFWVEIEVNTSVLFASGSAEVASQALPIVVRLSRILSGTRTRIQVEGHTDNQPIKTLAYPSNWELSAARAANVVRLFMANGVAPDHMAAVGFGEFRPVADNSTEEGRRQNRRVIIVVIARGPDHAENLQARASP